MNKRSHRLVFSRSLGFCVAVVETVATKSKAASGEGRRGAVKASIGIGLAAASLALQAQGLPGGGAALTGIAPRPNLAAGNTASTTLPTGGKVVKGSGSISVNGADMSVNQASQRLVTDWQSFSIGAGNSVRFVQPSSSSVALNRVTGDDASNIFGSLTANGHVYLENANGVYFAPGAHVSVGSLVATSLDVDIAQFVLGKLRLSGGSESSGSVSNAGSIVTASGGSVVLAAPVVSNSGSIATPGGTTALVAGNAVTVDPTGSGLLSISVPAAAVNARLVQSGTITADGGAVQLAAAATDAALRTVMQVDGVVRARSIEQRDGQILLSGGPSGMVIVDGQLDASGGAGAQGGTIKVLGDRVGLTGQGHLDASGATGGGTVLVGGNRHGEGTEANATNTFVGSGVVLDANATANGNGGMIVVWAEGTTTYSGQANARGGASGGNGGAIEVSGKGTLDFQGGADLRAPKGKTGELLLDPTSITIGAIANVDGTPGDDLATRTLLATDFPGVNSQITGTTVATLLATGDVSLAALRGISVTSPLTVAVGGAASTFSLAAQDVTINAPVTLNNASLVVNGSNSVTTNAALSSLNSISLTSPTISINAPLSAATMSLLTNSNSAFTSITQDSTGAGIVSAGSLTIDGAPGFSVPNSVDLSFSNNKIGALTVNAGDVNLHVGNAPGVPLVLSGTVPFSFNLVANNTSVTQNLGPTGALTIGAGEGRFNITTVGSGDVTLNNPANQFLAGMTFTTAGNVNVAASGDFDADGSATGNVLIKASGIFFLSSPISGQNIDISGAGFQDFSGATLIVPARGRFLVRSSDFTQDSFVGGSIAFGPGAGNINYIVYGGFSGTDPASGNGFYTNQTGSIVVPNTDATAVSKVYDGSPNFAYAQSGTPGSAFVDNPLPTLKEAISSYSLTSTGAFTDKNAGVDKGQTIAATNNTQALGASSGVALYGLSFAGFTRAPGVHVPGTPGSAISQITPKAITSSGIDGIDRVYDATTVVGLNTSAATLNGVVAGDTVSLVFGGASGTMANKNVGVNKAVAVNGLALGGADAGNYTVSDTSGATATITPKAITSVGFTGVGRVYDGTTAVAVNGSGASLASVIGGDAVGLNTGGVTGSVGNKNVGVGKPVAIAGVAINGVDAGNYTVSDASNATVTITQRPITSTGISGVDRTYDGTTAVGVNAGAATLNNTIAGDNVALVSAAATGTLADKNAGLAKPVTVNGLALGGTDAPNYSLTDASNATANIAQLVLQASGITATDHVFSGSTTVALNTSGATVVGVLPGDTVGVDASGAVGSVATPDPGAAKPVTVTGITLTGPDAIDYSVSPTPIGASGGGLTVRILSIDQGRFDDIRFKEYLQGVSDAQEPFRRAMLEALLSGFGKENIRKQLQRGLVFETGLAPPAVDIIESAKPPEPCTPASGAGLSCGR